MPSKRLSTETRIGWTQNRQGQGVLTTSCYNCSECSAIFYYVNDADDRLPPAFCPSCGRKNANAS